MTAPTYSFKQFCAQDPSSPSPWTHVVLPVRAPWPTAAVPVLSNFLPARLTDRSNAAPYWQIRRVDSSVAVLQSALLRWSKDPAHPDVIDGWILVATAAGNSRLVFQEKFTNPHPPLTGDNELQMIVHIEGVLETFS